MKGPSCNENMPLLVHTCIIMNRIGEISCIKVERSQSERHEVFIKTRKSKSTGPCTVSHKLTDCGFPMILGCILYIQSLKQVNLYPEICIISF